MPAITPADEHLLRTINAHIHNTQLALNQLEIRAKADDFQGR